MNKHKVILLNLILFITPFFTASQLYAQYPELPTEQRVMQHSLSPDGTFLAITFFESRTVRIFNIKKYQLNCEFENATILYKPYLFFSADSSELFIESLATLLYQYQITEDGINFIDEIKFNNKNCARELSLKAHRGNGFNPCTYLINEDGSTCFKKLTSTSSCTASPNRKFGRNDDRSFRIISGSSSMTM